MRSEVNDEPRSATAAPQRDVADVQQQRQCPTCLQRTDSLPNGAATTTATATATAINPNFLAAPQPPCVTVEDEDGDPVAATADGDDDHDHGSSAVGSDRPRRRHASRDRTNSDAMFISPYEMTPSMSDRKLREHAWKVCHDYLSGAWKDITPDEMRWKPISGGLSNYLYYCALPGSDKARRSAGPVGGGGGGGVGGCRAFDVRGKEPTEVLVRIYGQVQGEQVDVQSLVTESVIFTVLSERKLGPKLYGVFSGGRLEEYIPSPSLRTWELFDPDISGRIASQLAKMHTLQLPLSKEPTWIWETMHKWSYAIRHDIATLATCPTSPAFPDADPEANQTLFRFVQGIDFEDEIRWLKNVVDGIDSPVVFGHNDLQEGNILIERRRGDGSIARLAFIDFEYCSYNYRGFDLANHFCEWMYDYKVDAAPFFASTPDNFPSVDAQVHFLRRYIATLEEQKNSRADAAGGCGDGGAPEADAAGGDDGGPFDTGVVNGLRAHDEEAEIRALLDEVDVFQLATHLFWSMWSCVNAVTSNIPFGYWDYAVCRAEAYLSHKKKILERVGRGELRVSSPGTWHNGVDKLFALELRGPPTSATSVVKAQRNTRFGAVTTATTTTTTTAGNAGTSSGWTAGRPGGGGGGGGGGADKADVA